MVKFRIRRYLHSKGRSLKGPIINLSERKVTEGFEKVTEAATSSNLIGENKMYFWHTGFSMQIFLKVAYNSKG
jgi:hypothetical protein